MLGATEKQSIVEGIQFGVRIDGRGLHQHRLFSVDTGIFPSCHGSSMLTVDGEVDIKVGITASVTTPRQQEPRQGYLNVQVQL